MQKQKFTKAYARDFSIIMEEAWYYALAKGLWDIFKLKPPKEYPNFYFFNKGLIEVWESKNFIQKIMNAILRKNSDLNFFNGLFKKYAIIVKKLKNNQLKDPIYIDNLFEAISIFAIFWYGTQDNRTKKELQNKFVEIRDTGTIFDSNDKIVRKRLLKKFPQAKGFETAILKNEFLSAIPAKSVLKKRIINFALIPGKYSKITNLNNFKKENNVEIISFEKNISEFIKGTTAYPGLATGKVRIIRRKNEINKMKKGEILVSPMTTPDVFVAMKKARAIITDEGGQLCHAAILSRELKIPCIIGTKTASETYINGDLIEVDANNGVIKMIKRKK